MLVRRPELDGGLDRGPYDRLGRFDLLVDSGSITRGARAS